MNIKNTVKWLAGLLALLLLTGCQSRQALPTETEATPQADTQVVYASFYPIYALSDIMLQDIPDMELRQLIQPQDGCLRSYSLSDWDLYQAYFGADALIMGGRGLESFESQVQNLGEEGPAVIALFQNLELHNNGQQAADEDAGHLSDENPHLYLSARALPQIFESLCAYMTELDPMYADLYAANLENALKTADELIAAYDAAMADIDRQIPVALLNEALIYPAQDLNLNVACRIERESGTQLYSTDLDQAIQTMTEAQAYVVLIEKQAPDALVNALKEAGFAVVKLDILSTGRADMGSDGYFTAMYNNLSAITQALCNGAE